MANSISQSTAQTVRTLPAPVETLALRPGQVVEARVVGAGQGGTTQLALGNQLVDAALSVRIQTGVLIQLLVQGTGPNTRLTVLPIPPQGQASQAPSQTPPPSSAPQVQVQAAKALPQSAALPPPASSQTAAAQTGSNAGQPASAPAQGSAANGVQATPVAVVASGKGASGVQGPPLAVVTPGKATPGQIAPGRITQARGAAAQSGQPAQTLAVQSGAAPQIEPGTVLRVQIQGSGANARPVLVPVTAPEATTAASQGQSPAQAALPALVPNPLSQAVVQAVQNAAVRQDSITTLLTSLAGLGARLSDLPKPVAQAGAQLLAGQLNLSGKPIDGAGLKDAIFRSGVLFENTLSKGGVQSPPQGDLKGALLDLRNALRTWLGSDAQSAARTGQRPPPPTSGGHPRAAPPPTPSSAPVLPNAQAGARLLGQTEAALARMQLTQISSLPEGAARPAQGPAAELNFELPLLHDGQMGVGQFQISRDGGKEGGKDPDGEWKMRFSINFSQTGEVGATVSLSGGKTGVMLWAEREKTAGVLRERQDELAESLAARGLEPGAIRCRHGHPPQAKKPVGVFMDDCS